MTGRAGTGVVEPRGLSGRADAPSEVERLRRENEELRDRLSRLKEASLHMNEGLDLEQRPPASAVEQPRVLAVDADLQILLYVRHALLEAGYRPIVTGDLDETERLIEMVKPHLVLLNPALPGTDGSELMKRIPEITDAPVIFLSGHGPRHDGNRNVTRAFETRTDDYIVEPFSSAELAAKIGAALRRRTVSDRNEALKPYSQAGLEIDYTERRVTVAGRQAGLTATEYKLLFELSVNAGQVLTHDQLLRRVWGIEQPESTQILRAFVKSLRRKLGDDARRPTYVFTEPRVGYRMAMPTDP